MIVDKLKTKSVRLRSLAMGDSDFKKESLFFQTLLSEVERIGFDDGKRKTLDDESIRVIQKFIKNAQTILENLSNKTDEVSIQRVFDANNEIAWAKGFLPKMMDESEMRQIISKFISDGIGSMGEMMKKFKSDFSGVYDAKLLSQIVKEYF